MLLQFAKLANAVFVRGDGLVVEPLVGAFAPHYGRRRHGCTRQIQPRAACL